MISDFSFAASDMNSKEERRLASEIRLSADPLLLFRIFSNRTSEPDCRDLLADCREIEGTLERRPFTPVEILAIEIAMRSLMEIFLSGEKLTSFVYPRPKSRSYHGPSRPPPEQTSKSLRTSWVDWNFYMGKLPKYAEELDLQLDLLLFSLFSSWI